MANAAEVIREAETLTVEDQVLVVDSLLRSLHRTDPEIDRAWAAVAEQRLGELESGEIEAIPGDEVFAELRRRLAP